MIVDILLTVSTFRMIRVVLQLCLGVLVAGSDAIASVALKLLLLSAFAVYTSGKLLIVVAGLRDSLFVVVLFGLGEADNVSVLLAIGTLQPSIWSV